MSERQLIQSRHGPLYAYADDRYLGEAVCKYGEYSELEYQFLKDVLEGYEHPGTAIVEVGANAGYLTIPLQRHGEIFAFEPQSSVFKLLAENIDGNRVINYAAHLYQAAMGDNVTIIRCPRHYYQTPGNHGGIPMGTDQSTASMKAMEWDDVPCVTLDSVQGLGTVKFIKADVEGMELAVLRGARETISIEQPLLYVENDRPDKSEALIRYVWKLGYWAAWHCPRMYNPDNFFGVKENIYGDKCSVNMICVPNGRTLPPGVGVRHGLKLVEDAKKHPVLGM